MIISCIYLPKLCIIMPIQKLNSSKLGHCVFCMAVQKFLYSNDGYLCNIEFQPNKTIKVFF